VRILIIEDNRDIATDLYEYLAGLGHAPDHAADGVTGLHLAVTHDYDAIVLDLSLPGMSGLELCRRLREDARRDTPVLMLTARDTLDDKLEGFARGADDYLVKPFALKEVEARLQALHKRHLGRVTSRVLAVGDLVFDAVTMTVTRAGEPVKLPRKCLKLLEVMMQSPGRVFSRNDLEQAVWGDAQQSSDTLRSHMHTLRRALARPGRPDPIENVHGLGYRLTPVSGVR
jgi:DNA-binding response OmpR family regulator